MFKSNFDKAFDRAVDAALDPFWSILDHADFPFVALTSTTNGTRNFPAYNIFEEQGTEKVYLTLAIAGYTKERITVEKEGNVLIIRGKPKTDIEKGSYRHTGISNAAWVRTFDLNPNAVIDSVELKDGLLSVAISTKKTETPKTTFEIK